jgi:hypothetical protein
VAKVGKKSNGSAGGSEHHTLAALFVTGYVTCYGQLMLQIMQMLGIPPANLHAAQPTQPQW